MYANINRRRFVQGIAIIGGIAAMPGTTLAQSQGNHQNKGQGSDGVTGTYRAVYAWDGSNDWYGYNLSGQGNESGTVGSVDDLDSETRTTCDYNVQYRGTFSTGGYQDSGWIKNNIRCKGVHSGNYNSIYVHETDPRYDDSLESIWGTWGIFVDALRGVGNIANTSRHPQPQQ